MRVFSDWQNLEVELDGDVEAFIDKVGNEKEFGDGKLVWLFFGLKMLRSRAADLKCAIYGFEAEWLCNLISEASKVLGFRSCTFETGENDVPQADDWHGFNIIIDSTCSEIGKATLLSRHIAGSADEALLMVTNLATICRMDAQVSKATQIEGYRSLGFEPVYHSYYGVFAKGFNPSSQGAERPSAEVQKRSLFVVGPARSGSTAILNVLNSHRDIKLLFEANLNMPKNRSSIVDNFNDIQRKYERPLDKGTYLPTFYSQAKNVVDLISLMQQAYRLAGDKMAFGARDNLYEQHPADSTFDFLMEWFPHANYILTLRHPRTLIGAMSRMLPHLQPHLLIDFWLGGMVRMIDFHLLLDNSVVCFQEQALEERKNIIHQLIGFDLEGGWEAYLEENITTSRQVAEAQLEKLGFSQYASILEDLAGHYEHFASCISPSTGRITRFGIRQSVIDLRNNIQQQYIEFLKSH